METQAQNQEFGIPADIEAQLRAKAAAQVNASFDEAAILAKYVEEAKAKREEELRARASDIAADDTPDFDAQGFPKKYYEINIYKGQGKTDLSYVPVGVNGYVWKIMRGESVIVPSVVVDGLNDAVTEAVVQSDGGLITRPVHRFPYMQLGERTEEQFKAFQAKMREHGKNAAVLR